MQKFPKKNSGEISWGDPGKVPGQIPAEISGETSRVFPEKSSIGTPVGIPKGLSGKNLENTSYELLEKYLGKSLEKFYKYFFAGNHWKVFWTLLKGSL